ncbi:MAG TPA: alginate export family protein [Candidatus Sulfobium mesophilum]|nr:alginate export family protein [Candidatus Sulfobium mesophilum]
MLKRFFAVMFVLFLVAILYVSVAHAETTFNYGAAFRLRQEIWDDVVSLDTGNVATGGFPDRNFFRLRTQLWAKADFTQQFGVYARLANEMKYFAGPFTAYKAGNDGTDPDRYDPDELIVDNLYLDAKNIFGLPIDLRIGRQDFLGPETYGEGFLLLDGTPADGSRTFYFNAAKLRWKINQKNSVDFVYIDDPRTDVYMPSLHPAVTGGLFVDNKKVLTASREEAFVLYGRSKIGETVSLEPYYIYKIEHGFATTPKLKLNTIGARAVVALQNGWKIGGEFATQFGDYESGGKWNDRTGNGGYIFVARKYENVSLKPEFDIRYVYMSGDDAGTGDKNETFDPLFSRNPNWNELIIYPLLNETAAFGGAGIPGYWTNMEIIKASLKLNFTPQTNLLLAYQYLWAPEKPDLTRLSTTMFGDGKSRGHLPTAILSHQFTKKLDGMLQLEYFVPGSYYSDQADNATFFRWQLQYKI